MNEKCVNGHGINIVFHIDLIANMKANSDRSVLLAITNNCAGPSTQEPKHTLATSVCTPVTPCTMGN